jgi:hypothetical protein
MKHHADLLTPEYWQARKQRISRAWWKTCSRIRSTSVFAISTLSPGGDPTAIYGDTRK